jgi:hypothetical protein
MNPVATDETIELLRREIAYQRGLANQLRAINVFSPKDATVMNRIITRLMSLLDERTKEICDHTGIGALNEFQCKICGKLLPQKIKKFRQL